MVSTVLSLADQLLRQARPGEAEQLLRRGYDVFRELWGDADTRTRRKLENLVNLYEAWGRPDQAATYRARLPPAP